MRAERWQQINDLFQLATQRAPEERAAFLAEVCHGDEGLCRELESLIASYERAGNFIESPAFEGGPELLTNHRVGALVGELVGHYRIESLIGVGGMGEVYLARDELLGRKAALKFLPEHLTADEAQLNRLEHEARTASALNHPNILTVYEIGVDGRRHFIATEFIEGETLRAVLARGKLDLRHALYIAVQVGSALAAAHKSGVVHRDIKPENIMLRPDAYVKVLDFGIAKLSEQKEAPSQAEMRIDAGFQTASGLIFGTAHYMSPEQARGEPVDARTDIWSFGVVLFEMLAGRPPFEGKTPSECIAAVQKREPPSLALKARRVPARLEQIIRKALRKDNEERYQSVKEMLADLRRLKEVSESITSGWKRQKKITAFLAASVAVVLVVAGLFIYLRPTRTVTNTLAGNASPLASVIPQKSIAVLPFENLSRDPDNAYFADGIQVEVLTRLASIADLKVISRSSTQRYQSKPRNLREIAKQLGVANILEGSVQKAADHVRVNVQLVNAQTDSHLWANTYDRKLTDIFSVESEIAKGIADSLQAKLSGREEQALAVKPTNNPEAYDAYLRGLAYTLKSSTPANTLGAQKYLKEAVRLDPKFALSWALLSYIDARGYRTLSLQPTLALREEARHAAETALTLQPNLGEAVLANGQYHYACLKDYDTAVRYFEQARQLLPNNSRIPQLLAHVARRRGQWDRSESYFNEAEGLDPRNVNLLAQHAISYICLRRFPEALRKLDQVLNITPDDVDTLALKAAIAQAEGDLPRAAALLAPLRPAADLNQALETQVYQTILERRPAPIIPGLKEILAKPDPALGYINGELRFYLGWAQEVAGDRAAARESWRQARQELESFLKEQPENGRLIGHLALTNAGLGDKAAALTLVERAIAANPIEKDALFGPIPLEILARVAAQMGEPNRAIVALEKLLSIPYTGLRADVPLTRAVLQLDPMFDPLRGDPRFQKLGASLGPEEAKPLSESHTSPSQAPALLEKRIAVLPFENLSAEKDDAFFAAGIQDDVLTALGKIKKLQVIGRASVRSYRAATVDGKLRDIGRTLRVSHVLEGSVRRSSNRIVINVALLDTRDDRQVWSERYERTLTDTLSLQGELAIEIARALQANLTLAEESNLAVKPTENPDAYVLYLRARELELRFAPSGADYEAAIKLYQQAVDLDPQFALARARLSIAISGLTQGDDPSRKTRARAEAEEALRLRPRLGEARLAIAYCYFFWEKDYDRALIELSRVAELMPSSAEVPFTAAIIYKWQNKFRERIAALERATILDPRDTNVLNRLYMTFRFVRNWPEALRTRDQAKSLLPLNDRGKKLSYGRAWDEFRMAGNIDSLKKLITDPLSGLGPEGLNLVRYQIAVLERDYPTAERFLGEVPSKVFESFYWKHPKSVEEASLAVARGADQTTVERRVESARREIETLLSAPFRLSTHLDELHYNLGLIYAFIGRKEEAIREGRLGVELCTGPMEKNDASAALALIYARLGESDEAVQMIEHLLTVPAELHPSEMHAMTLTELKCRWQWDPLRSNARFQKILAGPEPKTIY